MSTHDLVIQPGLPFYKRISAGFQSDRDWWTALDQFEIDFKVREGQKRDATLIFDLAPFCTVTMPTADTVQIILSMTGEETATIPKGGYFRLRISDVGAEDGRAYDLLEAVLRRDRS